MLLKPKIDDLLKKVDSKYTLVILTAKRARQINYYQSSLKKEEGLVEGVQPLIKSESSKPLTIAMEEAADDKITYERLVDGIK